MGVRVQQVILILDQHGIRHPQSALRRGECKLPLVVKRIQLCQRLGEDPARKVIQAFGDVEDLLTSWDEQMDLILLDDVFQRRKKCPGFLTWSGTTKLALIAADG